MSVLTIILAYIAIVMTIITWALMRLLRPTLRQDHHDPKERSPIKNEVKRMIGIKPKGSIFIPPSDADEERQRIIEDRAAQGLDTPIDLLREKDD